MEDSGYNKMEHSRCNRIPIYCAGMWPAC